MLSSTMEVSHCWQRWIGHRALYIHQVYIVWLVYRLLYQYGATHIPLHTAAYYRYIRFYEWIWNVCSRPYFWCLRLQRRGALSSVYVGAVSQPGEHWRKRPSFGSIWIESHWVEVFVDPWVAVVEKVRKVTTKSGMAWGIYCKLQVTRKSMMVNFHMLLKIYPAAYCCAFWVIPMVPQFAVSRSDDVYFYVCRDRLNWTTADISCFIYITRKFFDGKVVWWWFSQYMAGILHETHDNYQVITYD